MSLVKLINNYVPVNKEEENDRQIFLHCIKTFEDVITRENKIFHFTSSAFVVNKDKTKVLMVYHNIYNTWFFPGGHADGDYDLLAVAIREVEEETGVKNIKDIGNGIYSINIAPICNHIRKGEYVSSHLHLSVAYLFEADENEPLRVQASENSDVKWIDIDSVVGICTDTHMKSVYQKIINRINKEF
jgi:8-oxo-dGTP pyrophosphatase MutT (NUDIX family)